MRVMFSLILFIAGSAAYAGDVVIVQAGQEYLSADAKSKAGSIKDNPAEGKPFIVKKLKIKKGDQVVFENLDKVTHNAYGEGFDLQAQAPGEVKKQKFEKAGKQTIKCAIHPKMKFELEVE